MIRNKKFIFYFLIIILIACERNPLDVEPSSKKMPISFVNLNFLFYNLSPNDLVCKIMDSPLQKNEVVS